MSDVTCILCVIAYPAIGFVLGVLLLLFGDNPGNGEEGATIIASMVLWPIALVAFVLCWIFPGGGVGSDFSQGIGGF